MMINDRKDREAKVMQILPEPEKPEGLSSEAMARVLKAAQENPNPRPKLRAHDRKQPTAREYAEHLVGEPLSDNDIQPEQPSLARRRVLGAEATKVLRQFVAEAQEKGAKEARASQIPTPDWQTQKTGLPLNLASSKK